MLALLYVRFGLDDGPVSVPDGAVAGDLILEDCDYATENGAYDAECGTLVVPETRRPAVAAHRVAGDAHQARSADPGDWAGRTKLAGLVAVVGGALAGAVAGANLLLVLPDVSRARSAREPVTAEERLHATATFGESREATMQVTIVGAGNMGRGIGTRAVAGGHEVEIVDRDPAEAERLAEELGGGATALERGGAFGGEVVVLAVYYPGNKDAVREYAEQLADKVVVDVANPLDTETWDRLATPPGTSSAEELQQLVPEGTQVVKAFNTTFAGTLFEGEAAGQQLDVLLAGDDEEAKTKVSQLVSDGGLRPIDAGPLARAQELEHLGFLHMSLQQPLGLGYSSTVKLHP